MQKTNRVRQVERIIGNSNDPSVANPSSSGFGQHKRVRFADQERPDPIPERDTEMQIGSQEALETRKRPTETDAERLEEKASSAEAEGRGNPEIEDSVMSFTCKVVAPRKQPRR